jgi:hypothetical protein
MLSQNEKVASASSGKLFLQIIEESQHSLILKN